MYRRCNDCAGDIIGRVLTITDAAAQDEVQRKALKDLIQASVWVAMHSLEREIGYFCEDLGAKVGETQDKPLPPERVSTFE